MEPIGSNGFDDLFDKVVTRPKKDYIKNKKKESLLKERDRVEKELGHLLNIIKNSE